MRKITAFIFMLITCIAFSQQDVKSFSYLVGSQKVSGYPTQSCVFDASQYPLDKDFNAPILQIYVLKKDSFIGGVLEDEKGKKTKIKDVTITKVNNITSFNVVGKDFSRGFNVFNGAILKEEKKSTIFYTTNIGVWRIFKN